MAVEVAGEAGAAAAVGEDIDAILRRDPDGTYPRMDARSRQDKHK